MEASRGRVLVHADVHDGELPVARDVDADVEALLRGLRHGARFDEIPEIALRLDLLDVVGRAQAAGARAAVVEYAFGEGLLRARAGADVLPEELAVLGVLRGNDLLVGGRYLVRSAEGLDVDGASGGGWSLVGCAYLVVLVGGILIHAERPGDIARAAAFGHLDAEEVDVLSFSGDAREG